MSTDFYQFFLNTKILFQAGISKNFSNELDQVQAKKFLLVTDPFFAENGVADAIRQGMEEGGASVVALFKDVPPNSEVEVVKACAALAKDKGAEGIVVVGGGSALDTAKAANILFTLGGDLVTDYSGSQTLPHALNPLIAIPTTAGTGAEVTASAMIYDEASQRKLSFNDFFLRPQLALLDPELTLSLPPKATAMTGMDALTHAIESFTSAQANPMSDALALESVRLIHENLLQAVRDGSNLESRSNMMIAANMAGVAFDHAMVGVVHSMSHATGGIAHVPHGLANSIYLPYGMEYNLPVAAEKYAALAPRFGVAVSSMSAEEAARALIDAIRSFRSELKKLCGLPDRLREAGVQEKQLEEIAQAAVEDGTSFFNPREVVFEDVLQKIKEAY
ncbi:MAG TPA: NAD-dependent alcohol dehydrogenase [Deltaproteobacteria bacterium]|nr:NAD-dependent alcohol dehydrogenase [Deltaproteobacteria bacterium]